ncbi:MAG: hypothetical protein J6333_10455, partial [Planctomycetes bacterium]|nr:hypothetical protein [Planctomycetota bacterium]
QRQQQQAAGGDWSGAQSQERGRRARAAANRAGAAGAPKAETEPEETAAIPAMRHIDGNSFELIA